MGYYFPVTSNEGHAYTYASFQLYNPNSTPWVMTKRDYFRMEKTALINKFRGDYDLYALRLTVIHAPPNDKEIVARNIRQLILENDLISDPTQVRLFPVVIFNFQ
jgi:hypothetical protein